MRKVLVSLAFVMTLSGTSAQAGDVGVSVGINLGNRPARYETVRYEPVYAPAPPPVVIEEPPEFIAPPRLGLYAAVGVPYDMFYVSGRYFLCRDNVWYSSSHYNGPWATTQYRTLPSGLRRYPFEKIRYYRDEEYRRHCDDDGWNRERRFRPAWREYRREEQGRWKEAKRWERKSRRHGHEWDDD